VGKSRPIKIRRGQTERGGWLKDRYGLYWQIVPAALGNMMKDKDRARAKTRRRGDAKNDQARHRGIDGGL
jgi:predicted 3-demethylubiquinone-9 3-methyltransferase (glyoxalase superfamily)